MEVNPSTTTGQDVPTIESTAENTVPIAESEGGTQETTKKRGRPGKKTSDVWSHFKIRDDGRAECNYCGQDYKYDTKTCGTSTLRTHVEVKCKKYPLRIEDKKQKAITQFTKSRAAEEDDVNCKKYDPKEVRGEIATYFILAELPFRHVQDEGFQRYTRYFYPTFQFPSRVTVAKDIYQMYLAEKIKLKKELQKYRVSLTTDCWTSIQNIGYMCLTAHWVSNDWTMQKRILSFIQVPSHKGEIIGKELIACLHDWGIDKVFCVTVDNASSNDVALNKLKSELQEKKRGLVLDGEMFHMRCCAHILNLVVCDGLKEISHAISCIRNAVRYPRSSTARLKRFKESCKEANIESRALLCLDVSTRWNSTFLMLEAALKFKKAFEILDGDANYTKYFEEERVNGKKLDGPPIHHDWEKAQVFVKFLRTFYKVTTRISGSLYVTSNLFFKEICVVQGNLKELGKDPTKLLKHIEDVLHRLYNFYKKLITPPTPSSDPPQKSGQSAGNSQHSLLDDSDDYFSTYFTQKLDQDVAMESNELDDYLNDRREKFSDDSFDILVWWRINGNRYKIVSQMAKDVLAIQVSTVASESAFSTGDDEMCLIEDATSLESKRLPFTYFLLSFYVLGLICLALFVMAYERLNVLFVNCVIYF
ncbi:hypothetical protein UlMin_041572 [Ulmus minor]